MLFLLVVSLLWAFSFGLIKTSLSSLDSNFVAMIRLGIALFVFLPAFRFRTVSRRTALRLALAGAIQYGGMYVFYLYSFRFLKSYEVALFTILTPLYVTLFEDLFAGRFNRRSLAAACLAIVGAWVVQGGGSLGTDLLWGFFIVQISNLCFAFGQIYYRRILTGQAVHDAQIYALPYLGGTLVAGLAALATAPWSNLVISQEQVLALLYLGVVASGLGFFLWNVGARRVNAGVLAIFNDLKIPLAVAVSLLFFHEKANLPGLLAGGGLGIAALLVNEYESIWHRLGKASEPIPSDEVHRQSLP